MKLVKAENGSHTVRLSASDLANHLGCRHLTRLDLEAARGRLVAPLYKDPMLEVLKERGFQHEDEYVRHLAALGRSVARLQGGAEETRAALRSGVDVIVQATFEREGWLGRADVLLRLDRPSALGAFSYEVVDTKLATETRAGTLLQLCLYSELLAGIQGLWPERAHVVIPGVDFRPISYRLDDFSAYFRHVRQRLLAQVGATDELATSPEPVAQCDVCRWWSHCDRERRERDHLALVAGLSKTQRRALAEWNVSTLTALAKLPLPLARPSRGSREGLERAREQARLQLEARERGQPGFELLPLEAGRGLALLPEPSPADVFFDIEGDPFVPGGGLEYLLGYATIGTPAGTLDYHALWATDRAAERAAMESLVDELMRRAERDPGFHVYHYAPYEPSAIKRLMGRYGTRQTEIDSLLRRQTFVDLYAVARQALRAGIERYSIKNLEPMYGFERAVELREASKSLRAMERGLELGDPSLLTAEVRALVEGYNRDDCVSTARLREWLETLRSREVERGAAIDRPAREVSVPGAALSEKRARVAALRDRLLAGIDADPQARSPEAQATWLLAHMLEWHQREDRVVWWEKFRLESLGEEELLDEDVGLAGLELVGDVAPPTKRIKSKIHRYRFPAQDTTIALEDDVYAMGGRQLGEVYAIDPVARTIDIKKKGDAAALHPRAVYAFSKVPPGDQADALFALGELVREHGIDSLDESSRAGRDLLLRRPPRLSSPAVGALRRDGESTLDAAKRVVLDLDGGVLALQGPPGAGKTFTAAHMIVALVAKGRKVGITGMSHKVIRNLLDAVVEAADEASVRVRCLHKVSELTFEPDELDYDPIQETVLPKSVRPALQGTVMVGAGTTWLWSRGDLAGSVDTLFIDEAGQMSLANALAVSRCAKNVVLLGDPQQLEQPLRASHPDGTEASALQHLVGEAHTLSAERGLFLEETYRLHPTICELTSSLFYESRLRSRPGLEHQALEGASPLAGSGLVFIPVEHEGNATTSPEEVECVARLYEHLRASKLQFRASEQKARALGASDVLVVAPYNAHVGALADALPSGARIGTVDKFQGQEAPVVIYTMATSSAEDAPRGLEFILSLHRLNVAISRARALCILVASPALFRADCQTPRQMQLANAHCRYVELARRVELPLTRS